MAKGKMSSIKDQIITLVKQRHHSHKVALEQEKVPRSKHAIDLIARIREDSRLIEVIDSLPEEIPPYVTGVKGHQDPAGTSDLEEAAGLYLDNHKPLTRYNWGDLQDAFIAGAEWQKKQDATQRK